VPAPDRSWITKHEHISQQQLGHWLALHHAPGFGPAKLQAMLEHQVRPDQLLDNQFLNNPPRSLFAQLGITDSTRRALRTPDQQAIDTDLSWAQQADCHIIPLISSWYPALLREIADPPILLFVRGDPELLQYPQLAMVGSRNPSHSGQETAFEFSRHLSQAGLIITSGMASGIDTASHEGALAGSGLSVAVAGTGLDRVYPAHNKQLAESILQQGTLVSEYSIGTPPLAQHFPRRNRIISGMSLGVLVVEAALQSGSLITARQATEQGREVFAIPGSIHNPLARGCHALIRQGAKLVETADDILQELASPIKAALTGHVMLTTESRKHDSELASYPNSKFSSAHKRLLACIEFEPVSIDTLVQRSRLTPESISSMLVELELCGIIKSSGGLYSRL